MLVLARRLLCKIVQVDILYCETGVLERHIEEFEKHMDVQQKDFQERIYNGCSVSFALKN